MLVCADRKKVIEMLQKGVLGFNYRNIANTVNQAINYKNRLWRYGY